jgi:hypothetical protein
MVKTDEKKQALSRPALLFYEIEICFGGLGLASSFLGMLTLSMPFSYLAPIFSLATVLGKVNERLND